MGKIVKAASAGTLESSDVFVEVGPGGDGVEVQVESVVGQQFGDLIERSIRDVARELEIESAAIRVSDRGALDCVLRARVETALLRGKEGA